MFDIAWSELLLIGGVALIVIGPKELPGALRTAGQMVGKVRRMASEFQGQFNDAMREAELHDLKKQVEDIGTSVQASTSFDPIEPMKDFTAPVAPKPDDAAVREAEAKLAAIPAPEPLPEVKVDPAPVVAAEEPAKPKRRRKTVATEEPVIPEAEPVAAAPEPAAKPVRKRKPKAAQTEDGSAA